MGVKLTGIRVWLLKNDPGGLIFTVLQIVLVGIAVFLLFYLSGCQNMTTDEKAYYVAHTLDIVQTQRHGQSACFEEVNPLLRGAIGAHPNTGETIAFMTLFGVAHRQISVSLRNRGAPEWAQWAWQTVTWSTTAGAVKLNQASRDVLNNPGVAHDC